MEPNKEPIAVKLYEPALDPQPTVDSAPGTNRSPHRFRVANVKGQITRKMVCYVTDFEAHRLLFYISHKTFAANRRPQQKLHSSFGDDVRCLWRWSVQSQAAASKDV